MALTTLTGYVFNGQKQITSKKTGEMFTLTVLRDYENFNELDCFPVREGVTIDPNVKIGEEVKVLGQLNNRGQFNISKVAKV